MKRHFKVALLLSIMLLSITGSAFAKDVVVLNITPAPSVIISNELTVVSDTIEVNNLQRNVTISRDFAASENIPASIIYNKDYGTLGKWSGILFRTNSPAPEPTIGDGLRFYYSGTLYRNAD
ncbi:hypothetical protein EJP82_14170 [Paenibacillus anaericanus]|uniref:Uncharacterized protein n=1 Tax=Paenibacillus anaericanus TaxID=170367 RepID=A0A3S1C7W6_9BACL|nr:hypothetical protein [Paenibacillus anaericanus]RUT45445.1 hypothetical protein EJP82_14170 [Paenibacillus anaericanus]